MSENPPSQTELREQAAGLRLHGLLAHWPEVMGHPEQASWVAQMLSWEATERGRRSLERRLRAAHIGRFKPLADFDWAWPRSIDRGAVEELMTLDFLKDASNVVLVGPNGVGKTMCACNLGYQAVLPLARMPCNCMSFWTRCLPTRRPLASSSFQVRGQP